MLKRRTKREQRLRNNLREQGCLPPRPLLASPRAYSPGDVGVSAITYAELRFGLESSARAAENLERLERLVLPVKTVSFDAGAGH